MIIKSGRLIDPKSNRDEVLDIKIKDGKDKTTWTM